MLVVVFVTLGCVLVAEAIVFLGWRAWRAVKGRLRLIDLATGVNLFQGSLALVGLALTAASLAVAVRGDDGLPDAGRPIAPTRTVLVKPNEVTPEATPEATAEAMAEVTPPGSPTPLAAWELCVDGVTLARVHKADEGDTLLSIAQAHSRNRQEISECTWGSPEETRVLSADERVLVPLWPGVERPRVEAKDLPLNVRIGQMLMTGFDPEGPPLQERIEDYHVGNFILNENNVRRPDILVKLTAQIQTWAQQENEDVAALIAVDQEGSKPNSRLSSDKGYTVFGTALELGCIDDIELTRDVARVMGEEMRAVGLNMNLAPVVDVNDEPDNPVIGDRAFGVEPERVREHGLAFIEGVQGAAVAATAKHYPGHGNTSIDSHVDVPTVDKSRSELEAVELAPFRAAVEANVAAVMTAHVLYPELDPDRPATLSFKIVGEILREELGFKGVVMTDALEQGTLARAGEEGEAAVMAVQAGVDLIAFGNAALIPQIHGALMQAVEGGRITEQQINESVDRILRMKRRFRIAEDTTNPGAVNSAEHREVLDRFMAAADTSTVAACLDEAGLQPNLIP